MDSLFIIDEIVTNFRREISISNWKQIDKDVSIATLAQLQARNEKLESPKLENEIRHLLYPLYRSK